LSPKLCLTSIRFNSIPDVKLVTHNLQEKGDHPKIHNLYDLHLGAKNVEKLDHAQQDFYGCGGIVWACTC